MNKVFTFFRPKNERFLCSAFFTLVLIDWIVKYFQNTWLHNFVHVPFYAVGTDFSYWILILTGIPQFILSSFNWAISFDILMTILVVWNLVRPKRLTITVWLLLYFIWVMTTNAANGSHFHSYNGFVIMGICMCFYHSSYFSIAWEMTRYYIMYLFASAALWKIFRGVSFDFNHLNSLMFQMNIWHAQEDPWYAWIFNLYTTHEWLSYFSMFAVIVLQLAFIVGFLTKKYDKWLLFLFIFFCVVDFIVFRHFFFELLVLTLSLLYYPALKTEGVLKTSIR